MVDVMPPSLQFGGILCTIFPLLGGKTAPKMVAIWMSQDRINLGFMPSSYYLF
jgi:hypothetical protein